MQKVMLFLASMLIVFSLSSCSKDDDSTITISPKEVTMKVDENKQLQTTGDIQKWSSENIFIASVSPTGSVTANHVGETNIMASGNANSATCKIIVEPQYSYYTSNPQPIGFRGNLLVKRQKFFYCTYSLGITETS